MVSPGVTRFDWRTGVDLPNRSIMTMTSLCSRSCLPSSGKGQQAEGGLADNPFATIRDGRLHLKRPDALEVPERVKQL
jgi:hypothetical protein